MGLRCLLDQVIKNSQCRTHSHSSAAFYSKNVPQLIKDKKWNYTKTAAFIVSLKSSSSITQWRSSRQYHYDCLFIFQDNNAMWCSHIHSRLPNVVQVIEHIAHFETFDPVCTHSGTVLTGIFGQWGFKRFCVVDRMIWVQAQALTSRHCWALSKAWPSCWPQHFKLG